jgi:phosphoglycerate dehydrogenase-like enzyme
VAEHTLMLILAVLKKLAWHHHNVITGKWRVGDFSQTRMYELAGKTLGIVGLGTIGEKVAKRARAFDMHVQYYDIVRLQLLRTSDVVTLHVPLTNATRGMMGAREFATMKRSAILINMCRGPVVDEAALQVALASGQIAAAGLDVMVEEPPAANHPLFGLENITITPHTAGPTWENWAKAFRNSFDNVQRVAAGRKPLWVIPELQDLI